QYIYNRAGEGPEVVETDDAEPIDLEPVEEDIEPEPLAPEPVEEPEEEINPDPVNTDGKPVTITDATFNTKVLESELPVVLEFGADWCPFCRQMRPIVESVALEHRNTFVIGQLDIDENPLTTRKYNVGGIPAYLVFRDGTLVAKFGGAMPKQIFVQRILDALK
ncbi:thioredoxin, partial [Candidatus Poribacteria bacterium]|nr:thioredoxin [Candidatus Poribacteria bacterium]